MSIAKVYDVLIIGGGPAGALAAYLLARSGREVLLIEQHAFPHDKVCGECLSALGITTLRRAGLAEDIGELNPVPLTHACLFSPTGRSSRIRLKSDLWGLSRLALDDFLLQSAKSAGAKVMQPARVESISPRVVVRDLRSNELSSPSAKQILLADGKGAFLPRRPGATGDFGIKAHFINVDADRAAIGLYGVDKSYGGVAPIESNRWNAAFSVRGESFQTDRGQLDALFGRLLAQNRSLQRSFRNAERIGDWCVSSLPRFAVARGWPLGVIPLGNAAAAVEPIGGEGMGLALRSAELVADALVAEKHFNVQTIRRDFKSLWRLRRLAARAAAMTLSSSTLSSPVVRLLSRSDSLASLALRLIGKKNA